MSLSPALAPIAIERPMEMARHGREEVVALTAEFVAALAEVRGTNSAALDGLLRSIEELVGELRRSSNEIRTILRVN